MQARWRSLAKDSAIDRIALTAMLSELRQAKACFCPFNGSGNTFMTDIGGRVALKLLRCSYLRNLSRAQNRAICFGAIGSIRT